VSVGPKRIVNPSPFKLHSRNTLLTYLLIYLLTGWLTDLLLWRQRSSVFRTSVFGWRTCFDLRLIYGWQVTTM